MDSNFNAALKHVLRHEGGYVNHPRDPGGATNKGITIATFRRYVDRSGTVADLKHITDAQVATVYRQQYWNKVRGDDLPSGIDYAVFDFAVNSGPSRAATYLQAVLGVAQDGQIGPATIAAARKANARKVIDQLCANRMAFLKRLKTWSTFGRGWTARVSMVETDALEMAAQQPAQRVPEPPTTRTPEKTKTPPVKPQGRKAAIITLISAAVVAAGAAIAKFACSIPIIGGLCG